MALSNIYSDIAGASREKNEKPVGWVSKYPQYQLSIGAFTLGKISRRDVAAKLTLEMRTHYDVIVMGSLKSPGELPAAIALSWRYHA